VRSVAQPGWLRLPAGPGRAHLDLVERNAGTGLDIHEVGNADLERLRDGEQRVEGRVPLPAFDFGEVSERQPDPVRGIRLRPPQAPSSPLNSGRYLAAEGLGAHPDDETSWGYKNVTHSGSLRLALSFERRRSSTSGASMIMGKRGSDTRGHAVFEERVMAGAAIFALMVGCKGSDASVSPGVDGSASTAPALVVATVGAPVNAWGLSWTVVDATDRGQLLAATKEAEAVKTAGRFVMVHYRVLNNGSTETSLTTPDLIDAKARRFKFHPDQGDHLPAGVETMTLQKAAPGVPREYWTIYDVAADAEKLQVFFAGGAPRIDLGTLTAPEVTAPAVSASAAPAQSLCADLDALTDYLTAADAELEQVQPRFKQANLAARGAGALEGLRVFERFNRETAAKGKDVRDRETAVKAHVMATGEAPIVKDLLKGYDFTATAFESYAEALGKFTKGLEPLVKVQQAVTGSTDLSKKLATDLRKRCDKLRAAGDGGSASPSSSAGAGRTVLVRCPPGHEASGTRAGCMCINTADPATSLPQPKPPSASCTVVPAGGDQFNCEYRCP
jgi:hypothetical protein